MESKYENLQKQVDLLKEENRRLNVKVKLQSKNQNQKIFRKMFVVSFPVVLMTIFAEIGYLFNLLCNIIELERDISLLTFVKVSSVFLSISVLVCLVKQAYKFINKNTKEN